MKQVALTIAASLTVVLASCSQTASAPIKTVALPSDGGEVGKAFVAYVDALKRNDIDAAGKALAKPDVLKRSSSKDILDNIGNAGPTGGRQQGDRATLFLVRGPADDVRIVLYNASRVAGVWKFDTPLLSGTKFHPSPLDCRSGNKFPCGVETAPDAVVYGTVPTMDGHGQQALIDGFAAHTLKGGTSSGTLVVLAGHGIEPELLHVSADPHEVEGWLRWPVLHIDIAPDNKHAHAAFFSGASVEEFDVADGLAIESTDKGRIRGRLDVTSKKGGAIQARFDIADTSTCNVDTDRCDKAF